MSYICGHLGKNSKSIANTMVDNSFSVVYQYLEKEKKLECASYHMDEYTVHACNYLEHSAEAFVEEGSEAILAFDGKLFQLDRKDYYSVIFDMVKKHEQGEKHYLNGDYAFVLYMKATGKLHIYRSAMGGRPIYYRIDETGVSFASNLEQLVPVASPSMYMTEASLKEYIANYLSWNSTGRIAVTPYQNTYNLLPGTCLAFSPLQYHTWEYWTPYDLAATLSKCSYEDLQGELRTKLRASIKNKLAGSSKAVLQLSGGVDSSVLACVLYDMLKNGEINIPISFEHHIYQARGDERYFVKKIQEHVGNAFDVNFVYAQEGHAAKFDTSLNHGLLPSTASFYNTGKDEFSSHKHQFSTCITGCGADQVFGGDYSFISTYLRHLSFLKAHRLIHQYSRSTDIEQFVFFQKYALSPLIRRKNYIHHHMTSYSTYLTPQFRKYIENVHTNSLIKHVFSDISAQSDYERLLIYDQWINSTSIFDMAHPFIDVDIIELVLSIPGEYRRGLNYNKAILRDAMKDLVPPEVLFRKQKGNHNTSTQTHLQTGLNTIQNEIKKNLLYRLGVVSENCIGDLLYRLKKGITLNMYNATRIISLEIWLESVWDVGEKL